MTRTWITPAFAALLLPTLMLPVMASAAGVRAREANQQQRIGQGLQSGQITAGGAARLEDREAALNATRRTDLATNGGHLTAAEHTQLEQRENNLSRRIYDDKHNAIAQPGVTPR